MSVRERALQRYVATVVTKRGGAEIRRAEAVGGVIGKAVALLRFAEHAGRQLRLIMLGMEECHGVSSCRNAGEHTIRSTTADRRDHATPFLADFRKRRGRIKECAAHHAIAVAQAADGNRQLSGRLRLPGGQRECKNERRNRRPSRGMNARQISPHKKHYRRRHWVTSAIAAAIATAPKI